MANILKWLHSVRKDRTKSHFEKDSRIGSTRWSKVVNMFYYINKDFKSTVFSSALEFYSR